MKFPFFGLGRSVGRPNQTIIHSPRTQVEKVVSAYLGRDTNYALLFVGSRGTGKTFFIKNTLQESIRLMKMPHAPGRMYRPVYISLYGLKNIEDVYYMLTLELYPILKNKKVKIGKSLLKIFTRGLLNANKLGNLEDHLKDLNEVTKELLDIRDFVLIFDDLDRCSDGLSVNELVGFINSLVEHESNKVILIADQEILNKDKNYSAVREKTIGTVVEFSNTFDNALDEITASKYREQNKPYSRR